MSSVQNTDNTPRIIIIGGEAAGMSAAAKARRVAPEATITVFEQSSVISFGACGLPYFIGDFFTNAKEMTEFTPEQFAARNIDVRIRHQVLKINAEQQIVSVKNLSNGAIFDQPYDKLLIATGTIPIVPPVPGMAELMESDCIYCVKTLNDGLEIKTKLENEMVQDVAVIGAGYIGLEMVEALERQGKRVRIFDSASRPLSTTFDEQFADMFTKELVENGISCLWQESVESIHKNAVDRLVLKTDKGRYIFDMVLLCAGVRPNTKLVENLGLTMLDNGAIVVDDQARTNLPNIFSAGDCAAIPHAQLKKPVWIPLATYANKLGRIAGEVMAGLDSNHFPGAYGAACLKIMTLEAGRVGLSEQEAQAHSIAVKTVLITDKDHTSYYPGQANLTIKLIYEPETYKILGGQIVGGRGAVLRVDALSAAIKGGLTTKDLGMLDLCYAPPFARTWDALNVAGNVAK